jgi:hypothetical protein
MIQGRAVVGLSILVVAVCAAWLEEAEAQGVSYRPGREYRSLNTGLYHIAIQKNGRVDVALASGDAVFANAFPMVWLEGDERPHRLKVDGRTSARVVVRDPLGEGNGMMIKNRDVEWHLRAYLTQPFFAVQVAFINTTKKPVQVKALYPWCVGPPGKGQFTLGAGTASSAVLDNFGSARLHLGSRGAEGNGPIAIFNSETGRSLVAGFLTHDRAGTSVTMSQGGKPQSEAFDLFQARCDFDPPITVEPGGMLESEVFYIAVAESSPGEGLERFGRAVAAANRVAGRERTLLHGWDSASGPAGPAYDEPAVREALAVMDARLGRYGWNHFGVGEGWQDSRGDWMPDSNRFPDGLKGLVEDIHARNMTAGLWVAPFLIDSDSVLAQSNPDWVVSPNEEGRAKFGPKVKLLDVTAAGALDYVASLGRRFAAWGFDSLDVGAADAPFYAEGFANPWATRVAIANDALAVFHDSFGRTRTLRAAGSSAATHIGTHAAGSRPESAPRWDSVASSRYRGAADSLTGAVRESYFRYPSRAVDGGAAFFGLPRTRARWNAGGSKPLTDANVLAWLTAEAMLGGAVRFGDYPPDLSDTQFELLRRLLPVSKTFVRPVDLFERDQPQIWSLPVESPIGDWQVVGLFNWKETDAATLVLDFAKLGLDPAATYTVYDFWSSRYFGTARAQAQVRVPGQGVRLLGLKPYRERPMLLSIDSHFLQGAAEFTAIEWNEASGTLRGEFRGIADTPYELALLAPEPYTYQNVVVSTGPAEVTQDDRVIRIRFRCAAKGAVQWTARFVKATDE